MRVLAVLLALAAPHPGCATAPQAHQLVTVVADTSRSTTGSLRRWRRSGRCWVAVGPAWTATLGINGVSAHHREGDGTTPTGVFPIGPTMYGVAPDPGVRFRYHRLVCGDWWDEDPASPSYDLFRHLACGASPPFGGGSEALWRSPRAYSHFAVIGYNPRRVPGRGSAIFLHADKGSPTNGCVTLPEARLVLLLRWLDPRESPRISISTR
jgi:L,D-peptidoglycan transpeptidase YkuD (ErfK/YbiS/YcfS/YnhG family)